MHRFFLCDLTRVSLEYSQERKEVCLMFAVCITDDSVLLLLLVFSSQAITCLRSRETSFPLQYQREQSIHSHLSFLIKEYLNE